MPKEEKEKYDEVAMTKFMGKFLYALSFSIFLFPLSELLEIPALLWIGVGLMLSLIMFVLVYMNTGNRFCH